MHYSFHYILTIYYESYATSYESVSYLVLLHLINTKYIVARRGQTASVYGLTIGKEKLGKKYIYNPQFKNFKLN